MSQLGALLINYTLRVQGISGVEGDPKRGSEHLDQFESREALKRLAHSYSSTPSQRPHTVGLTRDLPPGSLSPYREMRQHEREGMVQKNKLRFH